MRNDPNDYLLESLTFIAHGIARQFGTDCEVCIHDLTSEDTEHSIIYIINGHVTGRKEGDAPSGIVLESVEALKKGKLLTDRLCYLTRGTGGKLLKSSTIFIRDFSGNFHYVLSINLDITGFAAINNSLKSLLSTDDTEDAEKLPEAIPNSVNELLDSLISQSVELIGKSPALMSKDEKVRAIQFLNDAGAFLITKSGDKVAQSFGISKFTLYSYLDANKKPDDKAKTSKSDDREE